MSIGKLMAPIIARRSALKSVNHQLAFDLVVSTFKVPSRSPTASVRLETKSGRILLLNYVTKYDVT